jgi:hypothetical protein
MFTSGSGGSGTGDGTGEAGTMSASTTNGDGDGAPGDGDGDGTPGDGDGSPTTTTTTNTTNPTTTGDGDGAPGDCVSDPGEVGASCGQGSAYHGEFGIGQSSTDLPIGRIDTLDNGPGGGAEDWYQVDFPADPNNPRPNSGTPTITFAINDNNDYRFEVFRDCGAQAFGQGLASEFGAGAPPLLEWSFNDLVPMEEQLSYVDNVLWPTTVWIRVVRFQNDGECTEYQLQVSR